MKTKRTFRRETFSETILTAFVFNTNVRKTGLCMICAENSPMFTPEKIAEIMSIGTREIYRRIEAGRVHFIETDKRQVLVCLKSLLRTTEKN